MTRSETERDSGDSLGFFPTEQHLGETKQYKLVILGEYDKTKDLVVEICATPPYKEIGGVISHYTRAVYELIAIRGNPNRITYMKNSTSEGGNKIFRRVFDGRFGIDKLYEYIPNKKTWKLRGRVVRTLPIEPELIL